MARLATGNNEDALDIVQEAMFKLVEKYADRPMDEWTPLFQRILQSKINDWHRRSQVRNRFRTWLGKQNDDIDPIQELDDPDTRTPEQQLQSDRSISLLEQSINSLTVRQRQAFLLRCMEGLDVRQTAAAMGCSEGSVKTHYSRAIHTLRNILGDELS